MGGLVIPGLAVAERDRTGLLLPAVTAPAFTGRVRELAAVTDALSGGPAVVFVEGEAGIGKSRLIREYLASSGDRGRRALVAACLPLRQPHTLGPVTEALRQAAPEGVRNLGLSPLAGALRPLFPEWSADLPPEPGPAADASAARHRVFAALAELFARLDCHVLVTEDVHWADEASLEFLLFLASRRPRSASLVVSLRQEDVPAGSLLPGLSRLTAGAGGLRIMLGPLDAAGTAGLVASMLAGQPVSAEFAGFVHEHTEGVPLAAEELVRLLAARGDISRRDGGWERRPVSAIVVPPAVRDSVLERVARLSAHARAVLRAVAILADPAGEDTVRAVAGLPAERARAGLSQAVTCGLLAEDARGLVAFRHALVAQAVYEAIPGPDRRAAHRRAGLALEGASPQSPARLARHFRESGDTTQWCRYAEQASDQALAAGDEAAAAVLLHDLIVHAGVPVGEMARLTSMIALVSLGNAGQRDLVHALRVVLEAGNLMPREEAELRFQLGRVLLTAEESDAGRGELEKAVPGLAPASDHAARAMMLLGMLRGTRCTAAEHRRWLRRAAEASVSLEPAERLQLLVDRVTALLELGDQEGWAEASQIPSDPPGPGDKLQVWRGHYNVGEMAMVWGRYAEARQRLAQAAELADRYGYLSHRGNALAVQAHLDWFTGAWEGLASRAVALADAEDLLPLARLEAHLVAGLLDAAAGNRDRAGGCLGHVLAEALRRGAVQYTAEPAAAHARLALADGDHGTALEVTSEPAGIIARKGTWIWAADLAPARAEALAAANRYDDAEALVAAFARGLRGRDAPAPRAGLRLCRAILAENRGEYTRAAGLSARAAACWEALPRPYDALLARERQARCLLAAGSQAGAQLLAETRRGLADLGASRDADRVARTLRQHGIAVPPVRRGGRRGYGSQLSPREREVVRLVAAGHTNKQIAAALFRSPNTVAMQVKSARAKLGAASRTALADKGAELGIVPGDQSHGGPARDQPCAADGR